MRASHSQPVAITHTVYGYLMALFQCCKSPIMALYQVSDNRLYVTPPTTFSHPLCPTVAVVLRGRLQSLQLHTRLSRCRKDRYSATHSSPDARWVSRYTQQMGDITDVPVAALDNQSNLFRDGASSQCWKLCTTGWCSIIHMYMYMSLAPWHSQWFPGYPINTLMHKAFHSGCQDGHQGTSGSFLRPVKSSCSGLDTNQHRKEGSLHWGGCHPLYIRQGQPVDKENGRDYIASIQTPAHHINLKEKTRALDQLSTTWW